MLQVEWCIICVLKNAWNDDPGTSSDGNLQGYGENSIGPCTLSDAIPYDLDTNLGLSSAHPIPVPSDSDSDDYMVTLYIIIDH